MWPSSVYRQAQHVITHTHTHTQRDKEDKGSLATTTAQQHRLIAGKMGGTDRTPIQVNCHMDTIVFFKSEDTETALSHTI